MSDRSRRILWISFLAILAWFPTLRVGFIWDDHYTVESNTSLQSWSWAHVRHDFQTGLFNDPHGADFYRPVVALANRLDYTLYGLHPWGYHLSNLLFHAINSLLVWLLFLRLGFSPLVSLLTASFFAVHPINVQDMLMVTGRCGLLGTLFSLMTLLLLLRSNRWAVILAGIAFLGALGTKESAFMVPLLFLSIAYLKRSWSRHELLTRFILLIGLCGIYFILHPSIRPLWPAQFSVVNWFRFMWHVFPAVLISYAKLVIAPILLYSDRVLPMLGHFWVMYTFGVLLLGIWLWRLRERWFFFSYCWVIAVFLPPSIVMVSKSLIHDHWAYPALPGFLLPLSMGIVQLWESPRPYFQTSAKVITATLLIFWMTLAHLHVSWRGTDESFFRWSARFSRSEAMRHNFEVLEKAHKI